MPNSRLRSLILSISIVLIVVLLIGIIIYLIRFHEHKQPDYGSCPRPKQYRTDYDFDYTKRQKEYRNANSSIDFFRLSLSWSPTFCKAKKHSNLFQCQHAFGLIVHGLWPSTFKSNQTSGSTNQYPRNCRDEPPISPDIIRRYFCIIPSEVLMQDEWEKHGTCYWVKPEDYFEQIKSLYSKLSIPNDIADILKNNTISKRQSIKDSFLNANPQLKPEYIDLLMGHRGKLREVAFCYDRSFNHIECNQNM